MLRRISSTQPVVWVFFLGIILIGNFLTLQSPAIGVAALVVYFAVWGFAFQKNVQPVHSPQAPAMTGVLMAIAAHILAILPFYYFYKLTNSTQIFSFCVAFVVLVFVTRPWRTVRPPGSAAIAKTHIVTARWPLQYALLVFIIVLAAAFVTALFSEAKFQHIYSGFVPTTIPILLLGVTAAVSFFAALFRFGKLSLLATLLFTLTVAATIALAVDNLYGADSWRHVGIALHVADGWVYPPTQLGELLKFSTEKIPNASLYALLPFLHTWTSITIPNLYLILGILLPGIFALVLYLAAHDITGSKRIAGIIATSGLVVIGGYGGLDYVLNVRSIGMLLFVCTGWLWIRYLLRRDRTIQVQHIFVTVMSVLAYPTTGYFTFAFVVSAILLRAYPLKRSALGLTVIAGLVLAIPVPAMDVLFRNVPLDPSLSSNPLFFLQAYKGWWGGATALAGWAVFVSAGIAVGFIWLYRHARSIFTLVSALFVALLTDTLLAGYFQGAYAPFTSRVGFIFSGLQGILFGIGLVVLVNRAIQKKFWTALIAFGLLFAALAANANDLRKFSLGWSPSDAELQAIQDIAAKHEGSEYVVLTDEVTSAAGYAVSKHYSAYYWYPVGELYNYYQAFLTEPSKATVERVCTAFGVKHVYLLYTPIPPTDAKLHGQEVLLLRVFQESKIYTPQVTLYQADCLRK